MATQSIPANREKTTLNLTETAIRKSKPAEKAYKLSDQHGLFLLVKANGSRLWQYGYRHGGKQRLLSLGQYPVVSLAAAREKHMEARRLLDEGIDPAARKQADKQGSTFEDVALRWLEHWRSGVTERHAGMVERRMRADLLPVLGARQVACIEAADVVEMAKAIDARGAHETARRALEVTGQIFRYAVAHGLAPRNPANDVRPSDVLAPFKSRNFARVDLKELPALLKAVNQYHGAAETRLAMRLLAYTFVRTSELIEAPWSEIDLSNARWEIPGERMKMDKPHIVPLSRQAVDLFRALHQLTGHRVLCFPGDRRPEQPMSNNTILKALERLGYAGRMTGHGWRGIASTILHESSFEDAHIELQLAHQKRDKVAAAYDYAKHLKARTAMMQWYADHLDSLGTKSVRAAVA